MAKCYVKSVCSCSGRGGVKIMKCFKGVQRVKVWEPLRYRVERPLMGCVNGKPHLNSAHHVSWFQDVDAPGIMRVRSDVHRVSTRRLLWTTFQFTLCGPYSYRYILILSSYSRLGLSTSLLPSDFAIKVLWACVLRSLLTSFANTIRRRVQITVNPR
jgi:hypothetical protein